MRLAGKLRFEVQCEADRLREIPTVTTPRLTLTPLEERDEAAYNALVEVANSVPGCTLFDAQTDGNHNRCVFTLIGSPEAIEEVAFQLTKKASEVIDMTKHVGEHSRMGATDVIPFVPTMGVTVEEEDDTLLVSRSGPLQRTNVKTQPYPGFPTDMQPQIAVVLSLAQGISLVTEGVYGANRFKYMDELRRMGGQVQVDGRVAVIEGVEYLTGAPVQACDLRAGAALVIAGLAARGVTELTQVQFIERGYEDLVGKLRSVGADIRVEEIPEAQEAEAHIG